MESRIDEDDNLESQVVFGHLENTLAVRCLARNEQGAASREVKLVASGEHTHTHTHTHAHAHAHTHTHTCSHTLACFP